MLATYRKGSCGMTFDTMDCTAGSTSLADVENQPLDVAQG